jgi:hypothetical protein
LYHAAKQSGIWRYLGIELSWIQWFEHNTPKTQKAPPTGKLFLGLATQSENPNFANGLQWRSRLCEATDPASATERSGRVM